MYNYLDYCVIILSIVFFYCLFDGYFNKSLQKTRDFLVNSKFLKYFFYL